MLTILVPGSELLVCTLTQARTRLINSVESLLHSLVKVALGVEPVSFCHTPLESTLIDFTYSRLGLHVGNFNCLVLSWGVPSLWLGTLAFYLLNLSVVMVSF